MLSAKQIKQLREADGAPNRLKKAMEIAEVTHAEVAGALKTSQPHITEIVNGNYSRLPLETARSLAQFFGCAIEDLFPVRQHVAEVTSR